MARMMADCRRFRSESNCSLVIIGEEDEVTNAAVAHAIAVHGHPDTPETYEAVHSFLEPAQNYVFDARPVESMPT